MKQNDLILTTGIFTAVACAGLIYKSSRQARKRKTGQALLRELTIKLYPAAKRLFTESGLDPNYHERITHTSAATVAILPKKKAQDIADNIANAWGGWLTRDNTELIYATLAGITDKVQMSQVADIYTQSQGVDLRDDFAQRLSTAEIERVLALIAPLPHKTTRKL